MIRLGQSSATALISAPLKSVDLGTWMFTLSSEEYAACAGATRAPLRAACPRGSGSR